MKHHTRYSAALATAVLLSLAGCTVGPDYKHPMSDMPEGWAGAKAPTTDANVSVPTQKAVDVAQWWSLFNDPQLDSLVVRAMASNLSVQQATSRIRQARAGRGVVASGFWPTANVSGSYARTYNGRSSGAGSNSRSADLFQGALDAAWELDVFGGIRRDIEASEADIQAAVEDRRDVMVTLASEVALNYLDLRGLQQELIIAKQNLETQKRSAELTRKRFEGGFVGSLDVANADAQVATTLSIIPQQEAAAQQAIYNLGLLIGGHPTALQAELTTAKAIPFTPPEVPIGLPSDLLRRRPDIRRSEAKLHAATARVGVAVSDLFPKFSITGSLGLEANKLAGLGNWSNRFWSFGPTVSWPIFDAGRIRANINVQNEVEQQAFLDYQNSVITALNEVENALVAYTQEQNRRKALGDAVTANRRAVDLSTRLYREGQTDFLNVLESQRSLFASEDALVVSNRAVATNLVAVYKALGGGWTEDVNAPPTTTDAKPPLIPPSKPSNIQ